MKTDKQPDALRLAASLELCWGDSRIDAAASELRRLHAENETMRAGYAAARLEIESLKAQLAAEPPAHSGEPVATVIKRGASRDWMSERLGGLPDGVYSLYLAPQPVVREPLTHAQAKALVSKYGNDPLHLVYQVEVAHGIKQGGA